MAKRPRILIVSADGIIEEEEPEGQDLEGKEEQEELLPPPGIRRGVEAATTTISPPCDDSMSAAPIYEEALAPPPAVVGSLGVIPPFLESIILIGGLGILYL